MNLQQEIDIRRSEIRTDDYAMSIGELISLYRNKEIDIHPDFQRFFRWTLVQKSRLIESLLLGIPIPPIFVSQRNDGIWDVIDGLQRLSTIFEFLGILKDEDNVSKPPLILQDTKYLPSLKGVVWGDDPLLREQASLSQSTSLIEEKPVSTTSLDVTQRLLIKRAKIQVNIILEGDDKSSKYELFMRLNTGGSNLSFQELCNCMLLSLNRKAYEWLTSLSDEENFKHCVNLTDRAISERYDMELVLRFLVFRSLDETHLRSMGDLNEFLTKKALEMATSTTFNWEKEGEYFKRTFDLLHSTVQGNAFRRYDTIKGRFVGGFLVSVFETIAFGIGYNLDSIDKQAIDVEEKIKLLWQRAEFTEATRSGRSASSRISRVVPLGREVFRP